MKKIPLKTNYHVSITCRDEDGDIECLKDMIISEGEYESMSICVKRFRYFDNEWTVVTDGMKKIL